MSVPNHQPATWVESAHTHTEVKLELKKVVLLVQKVIVRMSSQPLNSLKFYAI